MHHSSLIFSTSLSRKRIVQSAAALISARLLAMQSSAQVRCLVSAISNCSFHKRCCMAGEFPRHHQSIFSFLYKYIISLKRRNKKHELGRGSPPTTSFFNLYVNSLLFVLQTDLNPDLSAHDMHMMHDKSY